MYALVFLFALLAYMVLQEVFSFIIAVLIFGLILMLYFSFYLVVFVKAVELSSMFKYVHLGIFEFLVSGSR